MDYGTNLAIKPKKLDNNSTRKQIPNKKHLQKCIRAKEPSNFVPYNILQFIFISRLQFSHNWSKRVAHLLSKTKEVLQVGNR